MAQRTYIETFDQGPGGWLGWISNHDGPKALEAGPGTVTSRSPWWIDYNHAPPGAGYLHMLFALLTSGAAYGELYMETAGQNRYLEAGFPVDYTNARLTFRLKGELEQRGAQLLLLIQGTINGLTSGWLLTGSPIKVTEDWSEQTIVATPDVNQWKCLGSRHDRTRTYGHLPLADILRQVNADIILVMFPLDVVPMGPLAGDPHRLRPDRDYPVWRSRLPEGYVVLDEVKIEFA
ncbi:MAG: hypothetical protein ABIZ80_11940 [Bryobacteraceae bacterium]